MEIEKQIDLESIQTDDREIEIDLLDLLSYYKRKIVWIIGAFLIGALVAGLVTQFIITPKYTASSTMYMVSSSSGSAVDLTDFNIGQSLSSDYAELIKTRPIVEDVIKELKLDYEYEDLIKMLNLTVVTDTRILKIDVTSTDPEEAAAIANSLALKAEKELPNLMDTPKPHIAETAIVPQERSFPSLTKGTMLGALLCMLIVLGALTVMYLMDDTIKSSEELEKTFGLMPLTVIPEGKIEGMIADDDDAKSKKSKLKRKLKRRKK